MQVLKRDGTKEEFNEQKILNAVQKSAKRINKPLSKDDCKLISKIVQRSINNKDTVSVQELHGYVEIALDIVDKDVSKSYKDYRNFKTDIEYLLIKDIKGQINKTMNEVDRSNSNSNTRYVSTQRTEVAGIVNKEIYQEMYITVEQRQAMKDGYIYVHDLKDMLLRQFNCCLLDARNVLCGGFNLEGYHYKEPKDIKTAVGQLADIMMIESAQHFGGLTIPEVDKVLAVYYKKTIEKYMHILKNEKLAKQFAYDELKQAIQGLEIKFNTVVSARGSYPFTTLTFGDVTDKYEADVCKAILEVRIEGHGDDGFKKICIFPKLVFIHNHDIHDEGKEFDWLFDLSIKCSSKCMYPDYIGQGHKREGHVVSPMGCRAYLSNYRDPETNELVFVGRGNLGAISLNLPMIYMKAKEENKEFFLVLDYYLGLIREMLDFRYEYVGKAKAYSNPIMFMEGGAYKGHLSGEENISSVIENWTASFGITALNELTILATGKTIAQDNSFAKETMQHIIDMVEIFKKEDGHLYAIYGTPAESLCGTQLQQFRKKYGIIPNVSDKEYFTNSFHCHVSEEITPIEKQNKEEELFHMVSGGHIQYVRISNPDNIEGLKQIIVRGLDKGFYQGVNFNACSCNSCGATGNDWGRECPVCGSIDINEINRTCGYLGFSRKSGDRTFNDAKMAEIRDRKSM